MLLMPAPAANESPTTRTTLLLARVALSYSRSRTPSEFVLQYRLYHRRLDFVTLPKLSEFKMTNEKNISRARMDTSSEPKTRASRISTVEGRKVGGFTLTL